MRMMDHAAKIHLMHIVAVIALVMFVILVVVPLILSMGKMSYWRCFWITWAIWVVAWLLFDAGFIPWWADEIYRTTGRGINTGNSICFPLGLLLGWIPGLVIPKIGGVIRRWLKRPKLNGGSHETNI